MLVDIALFAAGILVGGMNAVAGGGMLMGFPILLAAGLPPLTANATTNLIILPGQVASVFGYRKFMRRVPRRYLLLLIPCAVGAIIGASILRQTSSNTFEDVIPALIIGAVALFAFQPFLHSYLHKHLRKRSNAIKPLVWIGLATFPLAIYGGYFGAGFGFIMLAFLGFSKLHEMHQMQALKNVSSAVIALASLIILVPGNFIDWRHGLVMATGTAVGGYAGSRLTLGMSSHTIRILVVAIGVVTAGYLLLP